MPTFSLLTGSTVTTLGSHEVSEGCERKKGQRWGSLERRGMQAMDGEFSEKGLSITLLRNSLPPSFPDPRTLSQDVALPLLHLRPLLPDAEVQASPGLRH